MGSAITDRFISCLQDLKDRNVVRSFRQIARDLDFLPQNLSDMKTGKRDVTIKLLEKAIEFYDLNSEFIFRGDGPKILKPENRLSQLKVLNIVTDTDGNERIVHVNKPAQAGYATHSKDPEFIEELPSYSLPDIRFKSGTHRSFDVVGDSMDPSIKEGDRLICNFVEPSMWKTSIKNGEVYVVVTQSDIFVKRLDNSYRRKLKLFSDNPSYDPIQLDFNEVRELWNVKMVISTFNHYESPEHATTEENSVAHLQRMIKTQGKHIEKLLAQITN
ncbi:MAG TPA: S24 family peptidase [Bacteroidales bacterium]|nr:S24 family peptidase [Bacteroidales bacterium]